MIEDRIVLRILIVEPAVLNRDCGELAEELLVFPACAGFGSSSISGLGHGLILAADRLDKFRKKSMADMITGSENRGDPLALRRQFDLHVRMPDPWNIGNEAPEKQRKDE